MRILPLTLLTLACLAFVTSSPAQDFKVGVARADITPAEPIRLAGYASRTKPHESVDQPIWVKALALQDNAGATSIIITADTIGTPRWFNDTLASRIEQELKVPRERFLFANSHSHSTPIIHQSLTAMYGLNEIETKAVEAYTKSFLEKSFAVAADAVKNLEPATLDFGKSEATFAGNRRQFGPKGVGFGINPNGAVDHEVPVLRVTRSDGTVKAILFGYACHCTTPGAGPEVSGDWAGHAMANLEQTYAGSTALFITGCGADANPNPRGSIILARAHGLHLAGAVARALTVPMRPVKGAITASFGRADLPLAPLPDRAYYEAKLQDKAPAVQRYAQEHLAKMDRGEKFITSYDAPVQVLRFGNAFTMVGLSGETCVDYALRLRRELPDERLWVAGYCNDVFCYVPSMRILTEGGYEADFSMMYYGFPTRFAPEVENALVGKALELVKKTATP
ncbi:neutral/alkaline ceramidase-like enzyme [Roseimicrobium gellanilyticum]|uniref:Neutral/alkaline ceramidase-like enzyme n=1 Tax=Roseimicrobium gellanilyticum TaxID=748857 RepID=A0A366HF83_9BACT|nr:neutral/alkaline non-lysosomal ceramidase N-terminal domain-containing protein [Roseimicrobium gellanilyticum]RBP40579.1 neutral/alkaline ceramidase-like enzyme [Roseimicrobium gellanilyticum]